MRPKLPNLVAFTLLLGLTWPSCASVSIQRSAIATLTEAEKVERKALGETAYKPVQIGQDLYNGDLLIVRTGGKGTIQCHKDSTMWPLPADGLPRGVANTCP